ncbi:MAG: DUF4914 family protein [Marinilabiliaceae bacterium]|nr:DUF4914 family protein [Marinilabiliaceae bacterium]
MNDLLKILKTRKLDLSDEVIDLLNNCKSCTVYNSTYELSEVATGSPDNKEFEVKYDIPGKGSVTEVIVHRVKNGISANYVEPYMRRRDPNTMLIADNKPTDKPLFKDKMGYDFSQLKKETFDWMKQQDLAVFLFWAGHYGVGIGGMAIAPANAAFFAMGLSMLQSIVDVNNLPSYFTLDSLILVAPPFRHTHFDGKQIVVHNRTNLAHEIYSYNLYPGPSAKKGVYSALLDKGEQENWITAHCSTVRVISPYDNSLTFLHEGASGGGKSEMLQHIVREPEGLTLIGTNIINGEKRSINIPMFCKLAPITDDMAICHNSIQKKNGKLRIIDAENGWFIRTDSITEYGDDPSLEKVTISPSKPLLFLNIQTEPGCTALIWNHIEDAPGKKCPNPRVIIPRDIMPGVIDKPVSVDVRSFGVRTPPFLPDKPSYSIIGLFHILPPALAWLWRLVAPRGYANPSIVSTSDAMESEGVGSYWPFATGKKVHHANMLLQQIIHTPRVSYTLTPNQHIGAWKVGFKPQLLMREYLTRRGNLNLREDQTQPARCALLGLELNYLTIESAKIPSRYLKVYKQPEVGDDGYDIGAKILTDFFKKEAKTFLTDELNPIGRDIIQVCLNNGTYEDYLAVFPKEKY